MESIMQQVRTPIVQENETIMSREVPGEIITSPKLVPNGLAASAILAAGIGCLAMGVFTVLGATFRVIHNSLAFYRPVGTISGITTLMVVIWLLSWIVLHLRWKNKELRFMPIFALALILIGLGVVGIFPPFLQIFASPVSA
jgi:hypothetical protein